MQARADVQDTPVSPALIAPAGRASGMTAHLRPFHRSASIPRPLPTVPTATHIDPVGQEMAASRSSGFAALASSAAGRTPLSEKTGAAVAACAGSRPAVTPKKAAATGRKRPHHRAGPSPGTAADHALPRAPATVPARSGLTFISARPFLRAHC